MNQGKLTLREVGAKSIEMTFSQDDAWVLEALKKAAPHQDLSAMTPDVWAKSSKIQGALRVERLDPEYSLQGSFEARVPVLCPRCSTEGTVARSADFQLFLHAQGPYDKNEEGDDPDYIFLETPYIDLSEILTEQMVASEPVVEYPDQELSGEPHSCEAMAVLDSSHNDLSPGRPDNHLSPGQNDPKAAKSPFEVLGKLKDLSSKNLKK